MKDEETLEKSDNLNYQYPKKYNIKKEEYKVILVGKNFLVLENKEGNNIRVKNPSSNLYSTGEKIYKENGNFLWERA